MRGAKIAFLGIATAASSSAWALPAQARTAPAPTAPNAQADPAAPAPGAEGDIVVTAQRRSENPKNIPITVNAISNKDIRAFGVSSSTDIGRVVPNLEIALPGGPGNQPIISIRGIGQNDVSTNNAGPNGVYVDEVYMSSPTAQSFQVFDLQRIEVLKGPQGTLYGRNTIGGAINFITNKPSDTLSADAHIAFSSFDRLDLDGAIGGPITDTLSGRFAFTRTSQGGFIHNALTGADEGGQDSGALRATLLYKPSADLSITASLHGGRSAHRPTPYRHLGSLDPATGDLCTVQQTNAGACVDIFGDGTPAGFYDGAYNRTEKLKVSNVGGYIRADYAPGPVTLTSLSSYEYNDKFQPEDTDASPNRVVEIDIGATSRAFTQEFRASQTSARFSWVAGAYYLHEALDQNQPFSVLLDFDRFFGPGAGDGIAYRAFDKSHQITNAYAIYGQGDYGLTSGVKLTLGARYTHERRTFDYFGEFQNQSGGMDNFGPLQLVNDSSQNLRASAFSWRAALSYKPLSSLMLYASAATGFKSGDFNGGFLSTDPAQAALQLRPVRPEKDTTYEVGVKGDLFDRRLSFDIAAFYNDYRDMQVFVLVPLGLTDVSVLDNARKAHTEGIDAQLTARPLPGLNLTGQIGLLRTRLDDFTADRAPAQPDYTGNRLPLAPTMSVTLSGEYGFELGGARISLQANASYKSSVFFDISNDPFTTQPGYWTENLRVSITPPRSKLEIAAFVRNLTDKHYYVDGFNLGSLGIIEGVRGTPRVFGAELSFRY